jgi:prephenate dehydratase
LDLLLENKDILIHEEVLLPITQCLLAKEHYSISQITDVYSHPQALAQCHKFLHSLPGVVSHTTTSTAIAATMAARDAFQFSDGNAHRVAVIGSQELSRIYGLQILKDNVNDFVNNTTRFVVLSRQKTEPTEHDKTSIVFATKKDEPGSLYKILGEFASRNINLTRIYSRPTKNVLGEYLFYIDFEGHHKEAKVAEVLGAIQKQTSFYQWLGSYPKEMAPEAN